MEVRGAVSPNVVSHIGVAADSLGSGLILMQLMGT